MAERTMNAKVLHVAKTTAEWGSESTVISKGLLCVEFTTDGKTKVKIGDGTKHFGELPYIDANVDLTQYYNKGETDQKITQAISALGNVMTVKGRVDNVDALDEIVDPKPGDLYFVGTAGAGEFEEYVRTDSGTWEYMGIAQKDVDLSDYYTKEQADAITDALDTRVTTLEGTAHTHANKTVLDATTASFTTEEKSKLAGIAEGATAITVDEALNQSSTTPVQNKAVYAALGNKVDKADGKQLSTEDYTTAEKQKLAGIAEGANKTVVDTALNAESENPVQNKVINAALGNKVDKVAGKQLSTEDYTTEEKEKLAGLENYNDTALAGRVSALETNAVVATDTLTLNCTL